MPIIVRIDVDRPYGRRPWHRHLASRLSSDLYFPRVNALGYLKELLEVLELLRGHGIRAHVFYRRCTMPSNSVMKAMEAGAHSFGLHLENSRTFETFALEKAHLERHTGKVVTSVSKHGSGGTKYGLRHFAPYEPERYLEWAHRTGVTLFLGNLENPTLEPTRTASGVRYYPAAFWLEPAWRDTATYTVDWLIEAARTAEVVLLIHPENIMASPELTVDLTRLLRNCETAL